MELEVAESMAGEMASWKQVLQAAMDSHAHLKPSSFIQLVLYLLTFSSPPSLLIISRPHWEPMEGPQTKPSSSGSDRIRIHTDSRSYKIEEIKHCPFREICWYFIESWEKFRINEKIEIIDKFTTDAIKVEQREKSWLSISEKSKLQYLGPAPHSPYKEELAIGYELDPSNGPLDAFSLLVLEPDQVDYINLKSNERWIFMSNLND